MKRAGKQPAWVWRIATLAVMIACARDDGAIGSTSYRVETVDDLQTININPSYGLDAVEYGPSAAYVPGFVDAGGLLHPEQIVVTYDTARWDGSSTENTPPGWAILQCAGDTLRCPSGPTYTADGCRFDDASCNGGQPVPLVGDAWLGRPSVASEGVLDGQARNVVVAVLADTDGDLTTAEQVALVVSNDGGATFTQSMVLNSDPGSNCNTGLQDFPNVTFDYTTTPPTGYVVWRNKTQSSFGGCLQSFFIDHSTGIAQLLGGAHSISNMDKQNGGLDEGQGYLQVVAADGAVTVIYSNDDSLQDHVCGGAGGTTPTSIAYGAVTTFNGGADWTDHTHIFETSDFVWCSFSGTVQRGLKEYDAALGPDGNLYVVATTAEGAARLFMTSFRGVPVSGLPNSSPWREWCPTSPQPSGPTTSRWLPPGAQCPIAAFSAGSLLRPSIGFDANARAVVTYYHEQSPTANTLQLFATAVTGPRDAVEDVNSDGSPDGIPDFQPEQALGAAFAPPQSQALGYEPYDPLAPFADTTSANSLGWQSSVASAATLFPFPQGTRKFFAFWTQPISAPINIPTVQSARVDFTRGP